jgi:lincosamide nucleotidyltransferase A/C/D/E
MTAEDVTALLRGLAEHRVDACVGGGWAVDALLGTQTREHADLDLWLPAADLEALFAAFAERGVDRVFPWPGDRPWNFVLHDGRRRRVDLHLYEPRSDGAVHYGSAVDPYTFPADALAGRGVIGGTPVRCESPEWAVRWRTGYPPRPADRHDVPLLCARFGIPLPPGF